MAIVVGRNRLQSIQVGWQRGNERLAFAGDHFGDVAFMQDHAAEHLDVVMPQADEAAAALAAYREGFDEDVVECLACFQAAAELGGLIPQFFVGHRLILRLECIDRVDSRLQSLEESRVSRAEHASHALFEPAEDGVADARDDFPNAFENFHDELYGRGGAWRTQRRAVRKQVPRAAAEQAKRYVTWLRQKVYSDRRQGSSGVEGGVWGVSRPVTLE